MWSKELVAKGRMWKVGNGVNIAAFTDRWVLGLNGGMLTDRRQNSGQRLMVADLLGDDGQWEEKLESLFMTHEIAAIKTTPIGEHGEEDMVRWRYDDMGRFTVKSAYSLEMGCFDEDPYTSERDKKEWSKMVWTVSVPPKVKVFASRAFSNFIPTAGNLKRHHVPSHGICFICKDRWCSTEHSLLFCPGVRRIWKGTVFWRIIKPLRYRTLWEIGVRRNVGEEDLELWLVMLWKIWFYICRVMHGDLIVMPENIVLECQALRKAYNAARPTLMEEMSLGVSVGGKKWTRPKPDRVRVYVDILFDPPTCCYGVGIIGRDHEGKVLVAISRPTRAYSNVMIAEMMAVVHGIVACVNHEIAPVEIFTDSILTARLMARPEDEAELLLDDVCDMLDVARKSFLVSVNHMLRSANAAAHSLAQFSRGKVEMMCWKDSFPQWLEDIVKGDIS